MRKISKMLINFQLLEMPKIGYKIEVMYTRIVENLTPSVLDLPFMMNVILKNSIFSPTKNLKKSF